MEVLFVGLLVASLAGLLVFTTRALRVPIQVAPITVVSIVVMALFISDFVGLMPYAAGALHALGLALLAACGWRWFRARPRHTPTVIPVWIAVSVTSVVLLYWLNRSGGYREWDEFWHWGTVIKVIARAETFHFPQTTIYFQHYPPGAPIQKILCRSQYARGGMQQSSWTKR